MIGHVVCVSCMAAMCMCCFCSSRIMPSFLVVDMKLSGFTDRMFSVLYQLFAFSVVSRFSCLGRLGLLPFFALCAFSGVLQEIDAMLWRSGFCLVMSPLFLVPFFGVLVFGVPCWVAEMPPLCVGVLEFVFLVLQSSSCSFFFFWVW